MKRTELLSFGCLCVATALISGCGNNKNGSGRTSDNSFLGESDNQSMSYVVSLDEVKRDGCLNLEMLINRLRATSESTVVRRYTKDLNVKADENTRLEVAMPELPEGVEPLVPPEPIERGSSRLRADFAEFLTRSSFVFREETLREYLNSFGSFVQPDCNSVVYVDGAGVSENYRVKESDDDSIAIETTGSSGRAFRISFVDSQTMEIQKRHRAMDYCSTTDYAMVTTTQVIRWGGADILSRNEERVSSDYLRRLGVPNQMTSSGMVLSDGEVNESGLVFAPVGVMQQLSETRVPMSLQTCPTRHESPGTAPVTPDAEPTEPAEPVEGAIDPNTSAGGTGGVADTETTAPAPAPTPEVSPTPEPSPTAAVEAPVLNALRPVSEMPSPAGGATSTDSTGSASGEGAR